MKQDKVSDILQEHDDLTALKKSTGWKKFLELLDRHKEFLKEELYLQALRGAGLETAKAAAKLEDIPHILKLLDKRIEALFENLKGKEGE